MSDKRAAILFGPYQFKRWTCTFKSYDHTLSLWASSHQLLLPSTDNCLPMSMAPRFTRSTSLSRETKTDWEDTTTCHSVVTMYQSCTHPVFPPGAGGDSFPGTWLRHHRICKARLAVSGTITSSKLFKSLSSEKKASIPFTCYAHGCWHVSENPKAKSLHICKQHLDLQISSLFSCRIFSSTWTVFLEIDLMMTCFLQKESHADFET